MLGVSCRWIDALRNVVSQELFRDESKTEFVVVTIPSILAVAETERLVAQLRAQARMVHFYSFTVRDVG